MLQFNSGISCQHSLEAEITIITIFGNRKQSIQLRREIVSRVIFCKHL